MNRADPIETAVEILRDRYADADSAFVAGSVMRGEGTPTSDLDIVVLFPRIERSYRESFFYPRGDFERGWPIETFVHDEETIEYYFIEKDLKSGVGAIMHMVHDGVPVPTRTALNERIKARANALLDAGPPVVSAADVDYGRYTITGLLDDLIEPRNDDEARAVVASLHHVLANHWLRGKGRWGAHGKTIARRLALADAALARRFDAAFAAAFEGNRFDALFAVADEMLAPTGGRLFDGHSAKSDPSWRRAPPHG
jgi:predicted nucleotidyltransferase